MTERPLDRVAPVGAFWTTLVRLPAARQWRWVASRPVATRIALLVIALYVAMALVGDLLIPYSPTDFNMAVLLKPPSAQHWFGTDGYGRDVFSRVVSGTRPILVLALTATVFGVGIGVAIGIASGYRGGVLDEVVMRFMDMLMALPGLLIGMLIVTTLGSSKPALIVGIAVTFVPKSARVARGAMLTIRNLGFVEAARLRGAGAARVVFGEILPNVREIVAVEFCLRFAYGLLLISSLGFLGLGLQPPSPDWGMMINEGRNFISRAPWVVLFPALAIGGLVVAVNLLSDGLWHDRRRTAAARTL